MSEREEKLLRALVLMVRQYLEVRPDGTVDSYAKSAGEHAIRALVEYVFMEIVPRGRIFGRWTEAGEKGGKISN